MGRPLGYLSRYYRVRAWDAVCDQISAPFVWDRKRATLRPYANEEWVRGPGGLLIPAIRGGAFNTRESPGWILPTFAVVGTPAQGTVALDSAYTYNSAGDAIGFRVMLGAAGKTLSAFYFYLTAAAGTQANINDINFELRNDTGAKPGATLHTSSNMDPNGDASFAGWHKQDPADFAMAAQTYYWAVIADADGNSTDFATALANVTNVTTFPGQPYAWFMAPYSVTDGFVGATPSNITQLQSCVFEFDDGTVAGSSFASTANPTSNTERKGWRIGGFTEQISIIGLMSTVAVSAPGLELYDDATAPGGSTLASGAADLRLGGAGLNGAALSAPYTLSKATPYRLVFTFGSNTAAPRQLTLGTTNNHDTVLQNARNGGSSWYYAWANGTSDWSNDNTNAQPQAVILIEDQVAVAGGVGRARIQAGM